MEDTLSRACEELALLGCLRQIIKMHMRLSSDAVEQYIEVGDDRLRTAAHALSGEKPKQEVKQPVPDKPGTIQRCVKGGKSKKMKFSFIFAMHSSGDKSE